MQKIRFKFINEKTKAEIVVKVMAMENQDAIYQAKELFKPEEWKQMKLIQAYAK